MSGKKDKVRKDRVTAFCTLVACLLSFLTAAALSASKQDDVIDRLMISAYSLPKAAWCRPELPGCVPKEIHSVLFVSSSQAGQEGTLRLLESEGRKAGAEQLQLSWCNLGGAMSDAPYCFSQAGHHHTPEERNVLCNNQTRALAVLHQQPLLERLQCNAVATTMDFSIVYTLGAAIENTLVIFNVRDPIHLSAASHDVMVKLDPSRLCRTQVTISTPEGQSTRWDDCMSVANFTRIGFAGEDPLNKQTKVLAGDYCCYQGALFSTDTARLEAAFVNMNRVGAVLVAERMSESLQYLAYLLNWHNANTTVAAPSVPDSTATLSASEHWELKHMLQHDYTIYDAMQQRLAMQNELLAAQAPKQ